MRRNCLRSGRSRSLYVFIGRVIQQTAVIIEAYHFCWLRKNFNHHPAVKITFVYTKFSALYTYVNSCLYVLTHWKPLHPLCSWSGYGPDSYVTRQDTMFIKVHVSTASFCIRLINHKSLRRNVIITFAIKMVSWMKPSTSKSHVTFQVCLAVCIKITVFRNVALLCFGAAFICSV
jgi:hypothetical protein